MVSVPKRPETQFEKFEKYEQYEKYEKRPPFSCGLVAGPLTLQGALSSSDGVPPILERFWKASPTNPSVNLEGQ